MTSPSAHPGSLVLVRHGETDWSATRRHTGRTDLPLNDDGVRQAVQLVPLLEALRLTDVWSSPLQRAWETARLAGLQGVQLDPQLQEWDYGGYEGLTTPQIGERLGRPWSLWDDGVLPGDSPGESLAQVRVRCDDVLERLLPQVREGARVALVAHGHLLRVLATSWLGVDARAGRLLSLGPATVSTLTFEHAEQVLGTWNAAPALLSP